MLELPPQLQARLTGRLAPHALALLKRASELALRLHADDVGPEHLLCALMADEEGAAYRAVVHAFADPETIGEETLALAAGILISGSTVSLPFSTGAVRALEAARLHARERGDPQVRPSHLLATALEALPPELREELDEAGYEPGGLPTGAPPPSAGDPPAPSSSLFASYSQEAKRALSGAARLARQDRLGSIGPAHLALACLLEEPGLGRDCGLSASRARLLFRGRSEDATPPPARALAPDEGLLSLLERLGEGAGSLALLAGLLSDDTPELARLLGRHRISAALLERAATAFQDP
jgi:hypothetical protein